MKKDEKAEVQLLRKEITEHQRHGMRADWITGNNGRKAQALEK